MSACASLPEHGNCALDGKPIADRKSGAHSEMAIKLSVVIGSSPQMWLNLKTPGVWQRQKKRWMCRDYAVGYAIKKMALLKAPF